MPISKAKRQIIQKFLKEKQLSEKLWECCREKFDTISHVGRHVNQIHAKEIDDMEQEQLKRMKAIEDHENSLSQLRQRRGEKGSSDPISVNCQCNLEENTVILFYRYVQIENPVQFALDHQESCKNMSGKVRIASEGINATLAGSKQDIDNYLNWITTTQLFQDLTQLKDHSVLSDPSSERYKFFKPSKGCIHVFADLSIKYVDEICPLGQKTVVLNKLAQPHHKQGKLSPKDFHAMLSMQRQKDDLLLLDTRNYYESKIGHFEGAITPAIRKFSQFPDYVDRNKEAIQGKTVMTYCTGGIRCEKATAYMRQALPDTDIFMLDGGIHNYIEWCQANKVQDPIWQGKNYVFDARQALSLNEQSIVGTCQSCKQPWDKYVKCATNGCHLLVLLCDSCSTDQIFCCQNCPEKLTGLCACEQERRKQELKTI